MLRIYIDGLFYKGSGIGRYYESILKELSRKGCILYTSVPEKLKEDFRNDFGDCSSINPIFVNYEKFSIKGFLKQGRILKKLEKDVDLFFFPHFSSHLFLPKNTIVTIHDLIPFSKFWDRNFFKKIILRILINRAIYKSLRIICISEAVKNDLLSIYNNRTIEDKIVVIHEFVDMKFYNFNFKDTYDIKKPFILFVGNRKKHKNVEGLVKAFLLISDKIPHYLVIVGAKEKNDKLNILIEKSGRSDRIIQIISISDEGLISIYKQADLLIMPSFFEGFGLPPLEAVSVGCPALVSNIPVFKEIFGEDILYIDPYSVNDIAEKILYLLNNDVVRLNILKKQTEILKKFNKEIIIEKYISLFKSVYL